MYPISYKMEGNKVIFDYDELELSAWHDEGKKSGGIGHILISIEDSKFITYLSYGTLDSPSKDPVAITFVHNPVFDGKLHEPEWYLKPQAKKRTEEYWKDFTKNMKIVFLDTENNTDNIKHRKK